MARFATVLLLLMGGFAILFYALSWQNLRHKVLAEMREAALELEGETLEGTRALQGGTIVYPLPPHTEAALIREGKIVAKSPGYRPEICRPLERSGKEFLLRGDEHMDACYWERFDKPYSGAVVLQRRRIPNESLQAMELFAAVLIPLFLILLVVAWRLIGRIFEPIHALTDSIRQVSVEHFSRTIPAPERDDEIQALTDAYNAMILRLREGVESLERFNSDLAHELRTPLTVMRGEVELAGRRERSGEEYRRVLERLAKEIAGMERLSEGLLLLSRCSAPNIKESFEACSLDRLLQEAIERLRPSAEEKGIRLESDIGSPLGYWGNPVLLSALFSNLIDNALKYSPRDSEVIICLGTEGDGVRFEVIDRGIGIEEAKLRWITERFYRGDEARSRRIEGFGLGLALVKRAVEIHGGALTIDSWPGEGTRVLVVLPKSQGEL
jgi:signal transduction histidine kinase